jgi:hypothetical protein
MKHILLLTALFLIVGCNNEQNVNPIVLTSILDELESRIEKLESRNKVISASIIKLYNADGKMVAYLGAGENEGGILKTYNKEGQNYAYIGNHLRTYNDDGKETVYLGTAENGGGIITTNNADGKETVYLGANAGEDGGSLLRLYNGSIRISNKHEVLIGYFGTDKNEDGVIGLHDRYGDVGWSASGKK